jgi:hypothetical protein
VWRYTKSKTLKKFEKAKKSGSEGIQLSRLDNLVLDIIGRDSVQLTGLGIEDFRPSQASAAPFDDSSEDGYNFDQPGALLDLQNPGGES